MLKYLKAAFFVSPQIPGMGRMPLNAVMVTCLALLGIGNPGFWLLGLAFEILFLTGLASNSRFQSWVDAMQRSEVYRGTEGGRDSLLKQLTRGDRERYSRLETRCSQINEVYKRGTGDEFIMGNNSEALAKLTWIYLKLLLARQTLNSVGQADLEKSLRQRIETIESELEQTNLSNALKESKSATLVILRRRLDNVDKREMALEELDSDLTRIEEQVDLAYEDATMHERPAAISSNIELTSHLLSGDLLESSDTAVHELTEDFEK